MNAPRPLPKVLLLPAAVAALFFVLPIIALCARAPWALALQQLASPAIRDAIALSLQCSLLAALLSVLLGVPLAAWLAATDSRAGTLVRTIVMLPMVLPPVVAGVALLLAFGRNGIVGGTVARLFDVALPFTRAGVVVAETYVAMPFLVLTVEGGLRSVDQRFAAAAATLGAGPWRTFATVTLPLVGPSLGAGLLIAWARALGEFGATITFAGSLAGRTRTLPLAVYAALENEPEAAVVLSLVLVAVSGIVLLWSRRRWFPVR